MLDFHMTAQAPGVRFFRVLVRIEERAREGRHLMDGAEIVP